MLLGAVAVTACGSEPPPPSRTPVSAPRIVSISPAISRTLVDLGLQDNVVGRSAFCRSLDPGIPAVGDLHELDLERLVRLHPTHLLLQPPSGSTPDPQLERMARDLGWTVSRWKIDSIDDIRRVILGLPDALFPPEDPRHAESARRAAELAGSIAQALAPEASWHGRTLLVVATDPVLVAGRGTWLDEILAALGASNATAATGWPELSLEDVLRLDPEAIVLVRDRGRADIDPVEAAGAIATLGTRAQGEGRIAVLYHPDALLPSSAVSGVAADLRALLQRLAREPAP